DRRRSEVPAEKRLPLEQAHRRTEARCRERGTEPGGTTAGDADVDVDEDLRLTRRQRDRLGHGRDATWALKTATRRADERASTDDKATRVETSGAQSHGPTGSAPRSPRQPGRRTGGHSPSP